MPDERRPEVSAGEAGMFLLEVAGLIGIGRWGWHLGDSTAWRLALAALFILVASLIWTTFRTPGFVPSGREPVVAVPGPLRLAIEMAFYAAAAWGMWVSGWQVAAVIYAIGVLVVSYALRARYAGLLRSGSHGRGHQYNSH